MTNSANRRGEFEQKLIAFILNNDINTVREFANDNEYQVTELPHMLNRTDPKSDEIISWLKNNAKGGYFIFAGDYIIFETGEDATMFSIIASSFYENEQ